MKLRTVWVLSFVVVALIPNKGHADGSFWLEPQLGLRSFTGDPSDVLEAGPLVGGVLGYQITPVLALTGLLDVGFHSPDGGVSALVSDGVTLMVAAGGRVYPLGKEKAQSFQPFFGGGVGRAAMTLSYDEGAIAQLELLTGETLPLVKGLDLGCSHWKAVETCNSRKSYCSGDARDSTSTNGTTRVRADFPRTSAGTLFS